MAARQESTLSNHSFKQGEAMPRLRERDAVELEQIQLDIEALYRRAKPIMDRIKIEDEEQGEFAYEQFFDPLNSAMIGADDAIKTVRKVVEEMKGRPEP
jgi:hypothetical protein